MKKMNSSEGRLVVFAGFLTLTVAAGIGWYVFPVYLGAIHEEMGWSITQLTFAITVWALASAAFSPPVGAWIDKHGPRRVILTGTVCQIIVTILISRMTELWHMYALFVGAAFANAANTHIPVSTAIAQWFDEKRGTAMGIALFGMGFGGIIVPPLATFFLGRFGWRTGYLVFSLFLLALLVPISLWIKRGPGLAAEDEGAEADSAADPASGAQVQDTGGLTGPESMGTRSFGRWGSAIC